MLSLITKELQSEVQNNWVKQVNFVENATVPVVKASCHINNMAGGQQWAQNPALEKYKYFLDQPFNIDITQMTDHHNGLDCVKIVKEFLAENEVIEPVILVLKQFLKACSFNDPYFGGLSSYALFLMIVSFLQSQQHPKEISKVNLGRILLSFLSFYGNFDHENQGISTHLPGKINEKANHYPLLSVN